MNGPDRLHPGQVDVTVDQVRDLVAERFPQWRRLPVHRVAAHGTDHALFRVGADVVVRVPLLPAQDGSALAAEQAHARFVADHVTLRVPEPLGVGSPGAGYPGWWAAYGWIEGRPITAADVDEVAVRALASFVGELRAVDTGARAWDGRGRGGPLEPLDADVRAALAASAGLVDTAALARLWDDCLLAGRGDAPDVWLHADLMPGNLLVEDGRLAAVLDLGTGRVGDPAVDLMPAWNLLPDPAARTQYRRALAADDDTWRRGRGWALVQAICALPYYVETFPALADTARFTLAQLLVDAGA